VARYQVVGFKMIKSNLQLAVFFSFTVVSSLASFSVVADKYMASLGRMPIHAVSHTEGANVDLVKAIEKVSGHQITIAVYPFTRSILNVVNNRADFHLPIIKTERIPLYLLPYAYSTATLYSVNFVLYTRKGSAITLDNLAQYQVATDRAHVNYFPFDVSATNTIKQSLTMLKLGRIDAFIFADSATDPVLLELGYENIQRRLYKTFDVKLIVAKNDHGRQVDRMLSTAINKLKKNGELQRIIATVDHPYNNWQP